MADPIYCPAPGWTSDMVRSGEPVEISEGRRVEVMPTKRGGSAAQSWGAALVGSDPKVKRAGVELGVSTHAGMLRAPDVAVMSEEGSDDDWERTAPPLAIEYAGPGQDFQELKAKIQELLDAGTRFLWVVRLDGPRRVEVYERGRPKVIRVGGELLEAPGVLENPIPVEALYSAEAAEGVVLRNLLQRFGYRDLEAVRDEGHAEGKVEGKIEGKIEALRAVAERQLARRFPESLEARAALLEGLAADELDWTLDALWDAPDLASLRASLEARRADQPPRGR